MNELLQNIDWAGAGVSFVRIMLIIVALISGYLGSVATHISLFFEDDWHKDRLSDPDRLLYVGLVLLLVCIAALAILFGGLP